MAYFVYATNPKTGETISRFFAKAATESEARQQASQLGLLITAVVPSHSTSEIVLPEVPPPKPTKAEVVRQEAASFDRTLKEITPRVVITWWLVGVNVFVFILMTLFGVDFFDPSGADLLRWGAEYGPRTSSGESWRLFTSMFVHVGILHLAFNMIVLMYVAPTLERMFGHVGFLLTYLIAGLAGSWWAFFYSPTQIHAGASGAIFGLYGALLAQLLLKRKAIPPHVLANLRNYVLFFITYNLVQSLRPNISLAAHVGGLVGGFFCGLALARTLEPQARAAHASRQVAVFLGSAVLLLGGVAFADTRYANLSPLVALLDQGYATTHRFDVAQEKNRNKQLGDADFANLIERDLLPQWRSTRAALAQLKPVPPSLNRNVEAIVDYMALRQEHWAALVNQLQDSKGRTWMHRDSASPTEEEVREYSKRQTDYIDATWDLEHANPDASARGNEVRRLLQLTARVKTLEDHDDFEGAHLSYDEYSAILERDELPESHRIEQEFADLSPLPRDLEQDANAILNELHHSQRDWESNIAYRHYELAEKDVDQKRSRADDAAQAIQDMPGVSFLAP